MPLWRGRRPDLGPVSRDSAEDPASAGSSHFSGRRCGELRAQGATSPIASQGSLDSGVAETSGPMLLPGASDGASAGDDASDPGLAATDDANAMGTHVSWLRSGEPCAAN